MKGNAWIPYTGIALLYVLHNDWWNWSDAALVAGLPRGLAYHVAFMGITAIVLGGLVLMAWPSELDDESGDRP